MWQVPPDPVNEAERLAVLEACRMMDSPGDERFDRLAWLAQHVYEADVAFLSFVDAHRQWMKSLSAPLVGTAIDRKLSVCQHIISTGAPLMSPDLQSDPRFEGHPVVPKIPLRFYAGVPLIAAPDLAIGSLCVMRREPAPPTAPFDFAPLEALAAIAVDAVALAQRNEELTAESRIDALTGLANRRGFDDALLQAAGICNRSGEPLAALLIDVDRFKTINDQLGHLAGDMVLRRVGEALAGVALRQGDTLARYGGEEFVMLLPGSDLAGAMEVAARTRDRLVAAGIPRPENGLVTVSIGVAAQPGDAIDGLGLIARADAALYAAKRAGRDRVVGDGAEASVN
ncbi:sensor domain-containing diguanylate cyclase [Ancylobacter oerskovii]|uniref:diguanylate cyclase n=1 Tax=Ancylobacter oerskovii TaxID=459519 RepID=A0ABW4YYK8_9HYPH|nr:sensor domain-containing diguanylate cyclase [Ancylobacter oerskovii]MBS7541736.1 sensor domain-containing diguanylate cyclase [Ancylobacter oerskovii]